MTTVSTPTPLARLLTGGALVLAGALLAFALLPGLVGAQATEEDTPPATEEDAPATEDDAPSGKPWGERHMFGPGFGLHGALAVTAELTGASTAEVAAALEEGESLASFAQSRGAERAALVAALAAEFQADIDTRVADGTLSQERADELAAELPERVETLVDQQDFAPHGGPGCFDEREGGDGEETAADTL